MNKKYEPESVKTLKWALWTVIPFFLLTVPVKLTFVKVADAEVLDWRDYAYREARSYNIPQAEIDQALTANLDTHKLAAIAVEEYDLNWQDAYEPENQGEIFLAYFHKLKENCLADGLDDPVTCARDRLLVY